MTNHTRLPSHVRWKLQTGVLAGWEIGRIGLMLWLGATELPGTIAFPIGRLGTRGGLGCSGGSVTAAILTKRATPSKKVRQSQIGQFLRI